MLYEPMKKNKPVKEYREYWAVREGLLFYIGWSE